MRIDKHPILEFQRGKKIKFIFDGKEIEAFQGETIAAALHAAGVKVLGKSIFKHRPRGFYCAIGNCSSCFMVVNGEPNVRTCVTMVEDGMVVENQNGKGEIL
ncbi:(2Fe-2S)-binding protein [Sporosalibacterium faouarense]|uniref:(2Fe-2S)-binding protein n=1 Tax=Sporosalibacterium faouarense TaxID=516123 RepID=UPI00141CF3DB|nr:(2Fe-2S)-binding protein [Sporosalibacterium faouarense]MTI48067.1 (2Fe-2S)-binding protein [Bacillota bacterium]